MANTYSQVHLQFIFAPKFRQALILPDFEDELYKYLTAIVQNNKHKMLAVNGMPDHVHMLIGFHTTQSIADLIQETKAYSSQWINETKAIKSRFEWQSGYGVFSYSKSQVKNVIAYIHNQKKHHQKRTFLQEYKLFLEKFEIDHDERYIFREPE
jgi:REP element-mobilizing transposase RayT